MATKNNIVLSFDSTMKLFVEYRKKMVKDNIDGYNSKLSGEVHIRLWQLSFLCEKIHSYEKTVLKPCSIDQARNLSKLLNEAMIYAEAFYNTAFRIIYIAKHDDKPLPYLKKLKKKAKGIITVRNDLLVHPEGAKPVPILMISFSWGNDGPVFKSARPQGDTFEIRDNGLWVNAKEFKNGFEEVLQKAISR